jgi:hypothetical protein
LYYHFSDTAQAQMPNENWFKHLQKLDKDIWVDPDKERKDNKNATIVGWGLGVGGSLWICGWLMGDGIGGFLMFMIFLFGSFLLTED